MKKESVPPSHRTTPSMDKIRAVDEPPTKIVNNEMHLDPIKVIKAWADSADVLRDVAKAIRENQDDNDRVVGMLREHAIFVVRFGIGTAIFHAASVVLIVWSMLALQKDARETRDAVQSSTCQVK